MKIIIEIDDSKDHGTKLFRALNNVKKFSNCGGDCAVGFHTYNSSEMPLLKSGRGEFINCGYIGHDVIIGNIEIGE